MSTESDLFATGWRTNAVRSRDVQTVQRNGREYLQFPLVPLTEMVLDYPENGTKEYLPAENIRETADLWDGTLLTYVHPENRKRTVRDPDAFMGSVVGAFHDPRVLDGGEKLRGNGVIDVEKSEALGGSAAELVELLRNGEQVSVSAGYATTEDEFHSGSHDGEQYDLVQGPPLPDHIAVFPSDSQMQARCSPEDGCAAPKANAYQYGQEANQRANNGVRANMSDASSDNGSSVFPNNEERDKAIRAIQRENPNVGPAIKNNPDETLLIIAQSTAGYQLPGCDCGGTCDCKRSNARGRSPSRANMAAVPGSINRSYESDRGRQRENSEKYPAGGRRSWERRQVGLDDVPDESDEGRAGSRSAWEKRKANNRRANSESVGESEDSHAYPTGSRSSHEKRQNAMDDTDEQVWLDHEYPLTARRKAQEREERRKRREELKEQAKRNEARYTQQQRQNNS